MLRQVQQMRPLGTPETDALPLGLALGFVRVLEGLYLGFTRKRSIAVL